MHIDEGGTLHFGNILHSLVTVSCLPHFSIKFLQSAEKDNGCTAKRSIGNVAFQDVTIKIDEVFLIHLIFLLLPVKEKPCCSEQRFLFLQAGILF